MWTRLKQRIWQWRGVLITAPSVAGILMTLRLAGALQILELAALDQFFRLRPLEPADSRIVIVTIDESDITKLGQWPMSDAVLAKLLKQLKQQQPRAIGLDLYRNLPVEPGHQELVKVFKSTPNLIGVKKVVGNAYGDAVEAPPTLNQLGQVGASDLVLDFDGKLRRSLLYLRDQHEQTVLSLGAKLAFTYLQAEGINPHVVDALKSQFVLGQAVFVPLKANDGGYIRADAGGYQILSNFRKVRQGFRTVSITAVLSSRVPPDLVRDRIVLIGSRAESLRDRFYTPYSSSPITAPTGVEIHADLASQLLAAALEGRPLLRVFSEPLEWLWIVAWAVIGATLGWTLPSPRRTAISVMLAGSGIICGAYLLFLEGWWLIVIPPLLALVGSAIMSTGYMLWEKLKLSHQQLEDYARTLEQKEKAAQERAAELAKANVALRVEIMERQRAEQVSQGQTQVLSRSLHALTQEPDLDKFLGSVLTAFIEQLDVPSCAVWLYDPVNHTSVLHASCCVNGQVATGSEQLSHPDAGKPIFISRSRPCFYNAYEHRQMIIHQDLPNDTSLTLEERTFLISQGVQALLTLPLLLDNRVIGFLTVRNIKPNFTPEQIQLANALGHQISLAIHLTHLAEQSLQAALLEERNRMAREIHDTLAQAFTGVVMQLQAATRFLTTKPDQTHACIARAQDLAREGLVQARRSVWALRQEAAEYSDLATTLRRMVEQITTGTSVKAEVCVEGTPHALAPDVGMNLLRIGQEALTNALRHAQAQTLQVLIAYEPGQVRLCVQDDGQGFSDKLQMAGGFGLIGMQQRAARIGAQLTITSFPGSGTEVSVAVPIPEV